MEPCRPPAAYRTPPVRLTLLATLSALLLGGSGCTTDVTRPLGEDAGFIDTGPQTSNSRDTGLKDLGPPDADIYPNIDAGMIDGGYMPPPPPPDAGAVRDAGPVPDAGPAECSEGQTESCGCSTGSGRRSCRSDGTFGCCHCPSPTISEEFGCLVRGMVGVWQGTMDCPWRPQSTVRIVFRADGTYATTTLIGESVFYWTADGDRPGQEYELLDLWANSQGIGRLRLAQNNAQSGNWGEIRAVEALEADERLQFEFWNTWGSRDYGPLVFDLHRIH